MAASLIQSCWICELVHAGIQILFYLLLAENSNWEDWSHGSHPALLEAAPVLCLLMFLLSKARQPCSSPLATEWTNVARCTSNMKASIYCTVVTGTFISGRIRQSRSCSSRCRGCNLGCPSAFDPVRRASRSAMGTTQLFPRCLLGQVMVVPVEEEDILYVQHVMPLHTSFFFFFLLAVPCLKKCPSCTACEGNSSATTAPCCTAPLLKMGTCSSLRRHVG